jgi:AbrB family looped-hinge helix DNA binding protein
MFPRAAAAGTPPYLVELDGLHVLQFSKIFIRRCLMAIEGVISSKGQLVIPVNLRKRYGLQEGTTVVFHEEQGRLVLQPSNYSALYALQGSLRQFPLEADLEKERRSARKYEDKQ